MKKIISVKYSHAAFNIAMFILRLGIGLTLFLWSGIDKISHFSNYESHFMNFMGLGPKISLMLVVFAEAFCSVLLVLGLLTRLAAIPIIITMIVAAFVVHMPHGGLKEGQAALLYLIGTLVILFCGPGRISVDGMLSK